jgi:CBS domain-containing protein
MPAIMDVKVVSVSPHTSAWEITDEMDAHAVGCVVVVDDEGAPVGMVTDRDVVRRVVAAGLDEEKTTAAEIMSTELVTGSPSESGSELLERMRQHRSRRIPLVADGRLVGLASFDDVVIQLSHSLGNVAEAIHIELREASRHSVQRRRRESRQELAEEVHSYLSEFERDTRSRIGTELERWLAWLRGDRS